MRVVADEVLGLAIKIRKIAASSPGNQNLLTSPLISLQNGNLAPALTRLDGAHQSRSATAQNQNIKFVNYFPGHGFSRFRG
jgi:hypothetical protein